MTEKLNIANLKRIVENPFLLYGELSSQLIRANAKFHSYIYDSEQGTVDVMEEDWDNLIILDGCRYDTFNKYNNFDGVLEKRVSAASQSLNFIRSNFSGKQLHDTIYITSNPFVSEVDNSVFYKVISLLEEWNEDKQTVTPETVIDAAKDELQHNPDKRIIIHFMQPHYPFIGPKGDSLDHRGYHPDEKDRHKSFSVWDELQYKTADFELSEAIEAYEENLTIVLDKIQPLLQCMGGKTVITADHGNLLGERIGPIPVKGFGHPRGLRTPELVEVPWFTIDGERRQIVSEKPVSPKHLDDEVVDKRLNALGYVE